VSDLNVIFVRACTALWGERWQSEAASALDISDRHIRRMVSGEPVRAGMLIDLWRLILDRQLEMDKVIDEIKVVAGRQDPPEA
jgi:hypothetical protein